MKEVFFTILLSFICTTCIQQKITQMKNVVWDVDIKLPPLYNQNENPGLAGAFSGIIDGSLIIAGGANFPDEKPWEGGLKQWWNTLYVFDLSLKKWDIVQDFLLSPIAYGISIQLTDGILCVGGCDENTCYSDVFSIIKRQNKLYIDNEWPSLPVPLACGTGVKSEDRIYVFGGQESMGKQIATSHAFVLDLNSKDKGWQELPSWPGEPRGYSVSAAASGKIYLFSGRNYDDKGLMRKLTDGFVYDERKKSWKKLSENFPVMAGTAFTYKEDKIFFVGGVEHILPTSPEHPGFKNTISCYNIISENLEDLTEIPYPVPVTTNLAYVDNTIYILSGETRPGIRTPYVLRGKMNYIY